MVGLCGEDDVVEQPRHVLVVDDHEIIAKGCQQYFLEAGLAWRVDWLPSLGQAPDLAGVDVAVLDLRLDDGSSVADNVSGLEQRGVPVVAYTSAEAPNLVRQAIAAGVLAVVRKSTAPDELIEAVQAALRGEVCPGLDWAAAMDADSDFVEDNLRPSEREVLRLYAMGMKAPTVARALSLSDDTVPTYVKRIREKYRAAGRPADGPINLFRRAAEDGLVSYYE